ncbi:phage integrase SAM-like domain-containing protein [Candidatus Amoebophilus asiaticus]|uniref:phage integrase SAM-like domain-containing protein n=1 Tax=Candidatus Amoebophilus asiaticus TaxID=281120 RepID=UPI00373FD6E8
MDQTFLHNYETFLRKLGLAKTSMPVYFRTLCALFNKYISPTTKRLPMRLVK